MNCYEAEVIPGKLYLTEHFPLEELEDLGLSVVTIGYTESIFARIPVLYSKDANLKKAKLVEYDDLKVLEALHEAQKGPEYIIIKIDGRFSYDKEQSDGVNFIGSVHNTKPTGEALERTSLMVSMTKNSLLHLRFRTEGHRGAQIRVDEKLKPRVAYLEDFELLEKMNKLNIKEKNT